MIKNTINILTAKQPKIKINYFVNFTPAMAMSVWGSVFGKEAKSEEVDDEAHHADVQDQLRIVNFFRLVKSLQALHRDRETECNQKHGIHQSSWKMKLKKFNSQKNHSSML